MGPDDALADQELHAMLEGFAAKGFALAVQMLGNADDAADTVQDGLLVLWRRRTKLDHNRDPKAWFYRVLRNLCIDRLRRRRIERATSAGAADPPEGESADPGRAAEVDEYRRRLRRELGVMPEAMREILLLRDFHDLSYGTMADVLGIPVGTVMSRLHRARMALRDRMTGRANKEPQGQS
jgi:RNA polymerase sigma-70 factor (ECF subfamily)